MLKFAGSNYEILAQAVTDIANVDQEAIVCEVGALAGGSSKVIIDNMASNPAAIKRTHVVVDPYGGLVYNDSPSFGTNIVRNKFVSELFYYCRMFLYSSINVIFHNMDADQFMKRFSDGVPVYDNASMTIANKYALVHIDNVKDFNKVSEQINFFTTRLVKGGALVLSNVNNIDMKQLTPLLPKKLKQKAAAGDKIYYEVI